MTIMLLEVFHGKLDTWSVRPQSTWNLSLRCNVSTFKVTYLKQGYCFDQTVFFEGDIQISHCYHDLIDEFSTNDPIRFLPPEKVA